MPKDFFILSRTNILRPTTIESTTRKIHITILRLFEGVILAACREQEARQIRRWGGTRRGRSVCILRSEVSPSLPTQMPSLPGTYPGQCNLQCARHSPLTSAQDAQGHWWDQACCMRGSYLMRDTRCMPGTCWPSGARPACCVPGVPGTDRPDGWIVRPSSPSPAHVRTSPPTWWDGPRRPELRALTGGATLWGACCYHPHRPPGPWYLWEAAMGAIS